MIGFLIKRKCNTKDLSPKSKANLPGVSRHWFIKTIRAQIAADLDKDFNLPIDKSADARQHHICWKAVNVEVSSDPNEQEDWENEELSCATQQPEDQRSTNKRSKKRKTSASTPTYPNKRTNSQSARYPVGISVCAKFVVEIVRMFVA